LAPVRTLATIDRSRSVVPLAAAAPGADRVRPQLDSTPGISMRHAVVIRALVLLAPLFGAGRAAASAPDVEPEFGAYCIAGRTPAASWPGPIYTIADNTLDQVAGVERTSDTDPSPLRQIVFQIDIDHTWMGDLVLRLEYVDCGTNAVIYGTDLICRPRGTQPTANVPCGTDTERGCSGNLGRSRIDEPQPSPQRYWFSDESPNIIAIGACPEVLGSGCYEPVDDGALAGFIGLPRGGCFRIVVSDWAIGNTGQISSWVVWELDPPTPALRRSWGRLKSIYR